MTDIYTLLDQTEIWEPKDKPIVLIDQMTPTHVRNLLRWFELRAERLKEVYITRTVLSSMGGYGPSGDAACDAFDSEFEQLERSSAETLLNSWPLIKRLRELDKAFRKAERKIAATKNSRKHYHDRPATWEGTLRGLM